MFEISPLLKLLFIVVVILMKGNYTELKINFVRFRSWYKGNNGNVIMWA